jgi:hypothetical protein
VDHECLNTPELGDAPPAARSINAPTASLTPRRARRASQAKQRMNLSAILTSMEVKGRSPRAEDLHHAKPRGVEQPVGGKAGRYPRIPLGDHGSSTKLAPSNCPASGLVRYGWQLPSERPSLCLRTPARKDPPIMAGRKKKKKECEHRHGRPAVSGGDHLGIGGPTPAMFAGCNGGGRSRRLMVI